MAAGVLGDVIAVVVQHMCLGLLRGWGTHVYSKNRTELGVCWLVPHMGMSPILHCTESVT